MVRVAFKDANERVRFFYIVEDGVPAGSIISFNEPIISFNMPTVAFNEPIISFNMPTVTFNMPTVAETIHTFH